MRHVSPHRWADAAAGRLDERRRRAMFTHAAGCPRCAAARARVEEASGAIAALRAEAGGELPEGVPGLPALSWDHIGARIYWATSSERRTGAATGRERRVAAWRRPLWLAIPAAAAVIAVIAWLYPQASDPAAHTITADRPTSPALTPEGAGAALAPAAPLRPAPVQAAALAGVITFLQGEVTLDGVPLEPSSMGTSLHVGHRLVTGEGKLGVQFGAGSGFVIAPRSEVTLASFDAQTVEIAVADAGEVLVKVAPRQADQRLFVSAGGHRVEVRGTAFRVAHRDGTIDVACSHGRVDVTREDDASAVSVGPGEWIQVASGRLLHGVIPSRMAASAIADMEMGVPVLPAWTDARSLAATSAVLDVRAPLGRSVNVDGIPVGAGSFTMRVVPGRHLVQGAAGEGAGEWLALEAGAVQATEVAATPVADADKPSRSDTADRAVRRSQLLRAVRGNARLRGCLRPLRAANLEDAYVVLDLGVGRDGSIGHLNVVEHNLTETVAGCVRDVVDEIAFPQGPRASLRVRLAL